MIRIKVIGQRFELNDAYISVIAEVIETKKETGKVKKPKSWTQTFHKYFKILFVQYCL